MKSTLQCTHARTPIARFQLRILQDDMKPSNANVGSQGAHCLLQGGVTVTDRKKKARQFNKHPTS